MTHSISSGCMTCVLDLIEFGINCNYNYLRIQSELKRLQPVTTINMKFRVFLDVAPCSHIEVDQSFRVTSEVYEGKTLSMV
jgi:hypothetical protein